ncbi:MAG: hypothetical protein FWF51_04330 [Chitinivibrionia bacterium]|nr:hypothetical protein [Chitinivibrionia bacterium]
MTFNTVVSADTIILMVTALFSLGMFLIACMTIKEQIQNAIGNKEDVFKARRVEQLKIVVGIEKHISDTSLKLSEFSMQTANRNVKSMKSVGDDLYITALTERYLYAIDMLCYAINKKYFDNEEDWKNKYNTIIGCCIKGYEQYYGKTSPYKNTKAIFDKWNPI